MSENLEPVATPPVATPSVEQPVANVAPGKKKIAGLWAGVLAAVLVAGGAGYAAGNHGGGDRIDRVSFNGPMSGNNDDNGNGQLGQGNGQMGNGQGMQPGQGQMGNGQGMGMGPHCENTSGDHKAVNSDGSCPSGYTLDNGGGRGFNQPQPNASASSSQG
jgi:hypothetical protein